MEKGITPWLLKILQIKQTVFIFLAYHSLDQMCQRNWNKGAEPRRKKALIVTDEGLFKFGVADLIASYLTEAGVASHIFGRGT